MDITGFSAIPGRLLFRKSYLEQRLRYVHFHLGKPGKKIWDVGCGYGTTAIFATLNGHSVLGSTLEFYYDHIQRRLDYWSKYGDLSGLHIAYENLFDRPVEKQSVDVVLVQDTLHHLEPIYPACRILREVFETGWKADRFRRKRKQSVYPGKEFCHPWFQTGRGHIMMSVWIKVFRLEMKMPAV